MATGSRILESLGAYIKAQFQNAIIVIVLYIAGFAITGVPWWLLTGFVCGVVNLIPHLGPVITLFLAVLLKWFVTDDWVQIAYVAGVWLLIQIVDGFILSPRAAGR